VTYSSVSQCRERKKLHRALFITERRCTCSRQSTSLSVAASDIGRKTFLIKRNREELLWLLSMSKHNEAILASKKAARPRLAFAGRCWRTRNIRALE